MPPDVVRVAELNRLFARDAGLRHVAGSVHAGDDPQRQAEDDQAAEDAQPRESVRAAVEDLTHRTDDGLAPIM